MQQRAANIDTPLHATRVILDEVPTTIRQGQCLQQFGRPRLRLRPREPRQLAPENKFSSPLSSVYKATSWGTTPIHCWARVG